MGYTLEIGEAVLDYDADRVRVMCKTFKHDTAPAYGEPTDYTSTRWPSYSSWAESMRTLDMTDAMFSMRNGGMGELIYKGVGRSPLLEQHPGAVPISKEHVEFVEQKLAQYKAAYPDHIAQYPPPKPGATPYFGNDYRAEDLVDDPRYDAALCRGEWLAYWLRWAFDNCEHPVFVNS